MRHRAKLGLARCAIIVCVAHDALTLWQVASDRLVEDLLQSVKELAALVQ